MDNQNIQQNIQNNLQQWMLRNNKNISYGDLIKLSRGENLDKMDGFYSEEELKIREAILQSNRDRLQKFQ